MSEFIKVLCPCFPIANQARNPVNIDLDPALDAIVPEDLLILRDLAGNEPWIQHRSFLPLRSCRIGLCIGLDSEQSASTTDAFPAARRERRACRRRPVPAGKSDCRPTAPPSAPA